MELFVLDTETTGNKGVPLWSASNRLLQLVTFHPKSGDWFIRYVNYTDDFYIPHDNGLIHNITLADLKNNGFPLEVVLTEWLDWMKARIVDNNVPLIVAHNAAFDRNVIRKALRHSELQMSFGKGAKRWSWRWFDSLLAFRVLYPKLPDFYEPKDKPYSLTTLTQHFLKIKTTKMHNAETDVKMLHQLFTEFIVPKLDEDWLKSSFLIAIEPELPSSSTFNVSFLPMTRHPLYYDGKNDCSL